MRGQRDIRAVKKALTSAGKSVIDVSEYEPKRIPSAKWCELIKKVYEADPLLCPNCHHKMRIIALINESDVVERILRHLRLWNKGVRVLPERAPPKLVERILEPWLEVEDPPGWNPFPDYDTEPVMMYANE